MAWLKKIFGSLGGLLQAIWSFLFQSFTHYDVVVADCNAIHTSLQAIVLNFKTEVEHLKHFEFNPKWKTRVINVPAAVQHIQDLKSLLLDDFRLRLETIAAPVHEFILIFKAEQIQAGDPQHAVSTLVKAEAKLGEVVTLLTQLKNALQEVEKFEELFTTLRQNLETLDAIFLQQGNPKLIVDEHYRKRQR